MIDMIYLYRIAHWGYIHHIPVIPTICRLCMFMFHGSRIPPQTRIGKGTRFTARGMGVMMNGDAVIIGANSVVTKSIPSGCIVGGIPAKIIGYTKDLDYDLFSNQKDVEGFAPEMIDKRNATK